MVDMVWEAESAQDLMLVVARLEKYGMFPFFGVYVDQDAKNSTQYAMYLNQGGIGLPDRDYYFKTDEKSTALRKAYQEHINKAQQLIAEAAKLLPPASSGGTGGSGGATPTPTPSATPSP